jgi:glucose-1-phosphate thymidylyltransferase
MKTGSLAGFHTRTILMNQALKVVIPMAGLGTRLRPHTYSKPKQLISVAGKTILAHVLDTLQTLPDPEAAEIIFIVGHLAELLPPYLVEHHPTLKYTTVEQPEPRGQSHAIALAREHLAGPMLMVFADSLIKTDLSFLAGETADAVVWVKEVEDPRRFGVTLTDDQGWVTRLVEKPDSMEYRDAVVGFYYFREAEALLAAIDEQIASDVTLKGEFYLADAVNLMLEKGLTMRAVKVEAYYDAGTPEDLLATNRFLLRDGLANIVEQQQVGDSILIPPVYLDPTARITASVIGPDVSVGAGARVTRSVVWDSILEAGAQVADAVLAQGVIGEHARVKGRASIINVGSRADLEL